MINMQFVAMQDRTVCDLLGSIVDSRAHPPPKSIHRVDSEATFGRPRASIHDDSSSAQNRRPVPAPTGSINLRRELQLVEMLFSPTLVPTNAECLVRSKPQSERRRRCSGFPFLPKSLTAPLRK